MDLLIRPSKLHGAVTPPTSKSWQLRLILAAALAEGESVLRPVELSEDVLAALRCAAALGAVWTIEPDGTLRMRGRGSQRMKERPRFDCGEAAAVLRFFLPVSLAVCGGGSFSGSGRLFRRPMGPYVELFESRGISCKTEVGLLKAEGTLRPGCFQLPGKVSSQFFSGLLFALPLLDGHSQLCADGPLESVDYLRMTLSVLKKAGINVTENEGGFTVFPGKYRPLDCEIERDWSQAAFWLAAAALGCELQVEDLREDSLQGDRRMPDFIACLRREGDLTLDFSQNPDLLPPVAALAALRAGSCRMTGAKRLRYKESDRLATVTAALGALGAQIEEGGDELFVKGLPSLRGGASVDCAGDHRIAMMAAVASTRCKEPLILRGADCVNKSCPRFWEQFQALGGDIHVIELG